MAGITAGTVVGGKYRLEAPIGRGGMASVWRATHTTLEHSLAVKFLETFGTARDKMAKRFLREAKLAAGLRHRNVVHILDYGVADDGQPFMVMELLEGTSLQDRMDNGPPLSDVELFETMAQILSGLASVHDAGIVHRDVKPDNVFLVRDSDGDYPKLLDFGISRGADPEGADTRVTNTGAVVGTPYYMSPEQARGLKDLDHRTDLWSIGVVLWEALTGEVPFIAENMGDVLIRVATEDARSIGEVRPDLPEAAVEVVDRALMRDRKQRWQDARSMRAAVLAAADALAHATDAPRQRSLSTKRVPTVEVKEKQPTVEVAAPRARWPLLAAGGAIALLGAIAIAFVAFGLEIRFTSAAAEPEPVAAPPPAEEAPAPLVEPPPAPVVAVEEPARVEPVAPVEAPVEEPAPIARRVPRERPREGAAPIPQPLAPQPVARPEPRPQPQPVEPPRRTGDYLRELDY